MTEQLIPRPECFLMLRALGAVHVDLIVELTGNAPPRYRAEAGAILKPALPKPTHVDQDGRPVFSFEQIAEKIGVAVEEVEALAGQHINPAALYRGEVHPIR